MKPDRPQPTPPYVGKRSAYLSVFWFLQWYESFNGEPYPLHRQADLARAAGVAQSTISDMLHKYRPKWLHLTGGQLSIIKDEQTRET